MAQLQRRRIHDWRDPVDAVRPQNPPAKTHIAIGPARPKGRWQAILGQLVGFSVVSALAGTCLAAGLGYMGVIAGILSAAPLVAIGLVRWGLWILDNVPY